MSGEYTPTVVSTGPVTPAPTPFSITLSFIHGSLAGTSQTFTSPVITFGRGPDNDLRFDPARDTKVSTRHGQLRLDSSSGQWFVEDLRSTNGTFIDGNRIDGPAALASGMTVVLGDAGEAGGVIFTVLLNGGPSNVDIFSPPAGIGAPPSTVPEPQTPYAADPSGPGAPPPQQPPGDAKPGFFGKMKGKLNRFVESQKLKGHVKTLQGNLQQLSQQHVPLYAALGRELVEGDHISHEKLASLPGSVKVRELQGTTRDHESKIVGIEDDIRAVEASHQDWVSTFGSSFNQLESAHQVASGELDTARTAFSDATSALNEILQPRLEAMDTLAAALTNGGGAVRAAPQATTNEQLGAITQSVRDALTVLEPPLEGLPDAVARLESAKTVLAEADAKFTDLGKQLETERTVKAQKESEYEALLAEKKKQIDEQRSAIASVASQIEQQYPEIGQHATHADAAGELGIESLQQIGAARGALDAYKGVEAEIAKANERMEELARG